MNHPRATMRLQFNKVFTFYDATRLVPYMARLGISHLYASPIMTARPGSMHGYDVTDPTRVNPELGGEDGLRRLIASLRQANLGVIVDIVPNHMAIGSDNPWWLDVLERGQQSRYAHFFDIDWQPPDPALRGKVFAPFLGRPYGEALAAGEITLERNSANNGFVVRCPGHAFPVARRDWIEIERLTLAGFAPMTDEGRQRLHALLERQYYRLAWWRTANDEINWRRFFDINDLIGVRVEDEEVFETTHAALFQLYREGLIDGMRVDHVDGLSCPEEYCRRIRTRLKALEALRPADAPGGSAYFVVEKILGSDEHIPEDWDCDGTTGYDFMDEVSALLHNPAGEGALTRLWASVSGRSPCFSAEEKISRRETLDRSFSAQLDRVVLAFHRLARAGLSTRDMSRAAIRRALVELIVHFPVYRIYATPDRRSQADRSFLARAINGAKATCLPADRPVLDLLHDWLGGNAAHPDAHEMHAIALTRFHQLTAPVCAKAVEDTAFYRYGRLLSRIDVGFDAALFARTPGEFHARMRERRSWPPHSMLATATHDHKRGEDVRARLAVLSEVADEWSAALDRWIKQSAALRQRVDGELAPAPRDLAILFQTIVGAWPTELAVEGQEGLSAFAERLARWQQKALREAKIASDWSSPNEMYEAAAHEFLMRLFADEAGSHLLADVFRFADRIGPAGAANGLAQTLLKLTAPGVPDIYQGTEYWDLSLVDPDNRRPVDFTARAKSLSSTSIVELATNWRDGRVKQAAIARTLAVRKTAPRLLAEGGYLPIPVNGPLAKHVVAFARHFQDCMAITIVSRLTTNLLSKSNDLSIPNWKGTHLDIPRRRRDGQLYDVIRQAEFASNEASVDLASVLGQLPIAFLVSDRLRPPDH